MDNTRIILIEKFLDDIRSQDEAREILALLDEDEEFTDELMNAVRVKGSIMSAVHEDRECEQLAHIVEVALGPSDDRGSFESRVIQRLQKRRTRRTNWRIPIAAAACIILAAGAYMFNLYRMSGKYAGSIAEIYGNVRIERNGRNIPAEKGMAVLSEDTVVTGTDSLCRVDSGNGSIVALNENTGLVFHSDRHGLNLLKYREGQVFADIAKRDREFTVSSEDFVLTVLGTQFQIRPSDIQDHSIVDVFQGSVKVKNKTMGGNISEGYTGILVKYIWKRPDMAGKTERRLHVSAPSPDSIPVEWLVRLNCCYPGLLAAYRIRRRDHLINYNNYLITSGTWRMEQKDDDVVIVQENRAGDAYILFGKTEWKKGTVHVDFRIREYTRGNIRRSIGICFFYDDERKIPEAFCLNKQLERLIETNHTGWMHWEIDFRTSNNGIDVNMSVDTIPHTVKREIRMLHRDSGNSKITVRNKAGIGLMCLGVSAEFRNFRIIPR